MSERRSAETADCDPHAYDEGWARAEGEAGPTPKWRALLERVRRARDERLPLRWERVLSEPARLPLDAPEIVRPTARQRAETRERFAARGFAWTAMLGRAPPEELAEFFDLVAYVSLDDEGVLAPVEHWSWSQRGPLGGLVLSSGGYEGGELVALVDETDGDFVRAAIAHVRDGRTTATFANFAAFLHRLIP